jgi:NADP-dependent 3-hydroxy acid dehydrogenase YdfG
VSQDPVALVTGAAAGIGRATARRLASEPMAVALVDRDHPTLEDLAEELRADGASVRTFGVDVTDGDAVDALVAELGAAEAVPRVVVNNAGTAVRADVVATDPVDWDRVLAVNLTAVYRVCRAVIPGMIAAGGGVIVNVASVAGMVGIPARAAYCASKAGVVGLPRATRVPSSSGRSWRGVVCSLG